MKKDFLPLDDSIIDTIAKSPLRLEELAAVSVVRNRALRLNIRRSGVPPSSSTDMTINERLQLLRREGKLAYDPGSSRWKVLRRSDSLLGAVPGCRGFG
jgi:hypothetical protein